MNRLESLITERKKELQELEDNRGTRFPIFEQARDIRISYLTEELSDLEMLREHDKYQLNEDQQIVLGHLQGSAGQEGSLLLAANPLVNLTKYDNLWEQYEKVNTAYCLLTRKQEAEVLQAFAEWGLGHERTTNS
ncbi:hypothetical protein CKN73_01390 [Carnobacterium divergens]|uniref:hypothetical protein n=1 Tax=Carnobacterium divergens TaxID=2748 RepID=UPI001071E915|nr:hypothetical protein [Carnobacterium divergens]TFJ45125.1 hypothetical protein CKN77_01385 [Carnobacterium divergens]TFJ52194.1 hypothetical protein CKN73_01390 [Carnobacterium divergens]TFJ57771.1 hypothetical protein CKN83_01385 [Carnobacterium divergens]TFJ65786.1 hypothetical protein CKN89_01390 [Carnobacterium divergens]TFJ74091.1 hypothetical protein CKN91_01385 [Carnobacterium divergens]